MFDGKMKAVTFSYDDGTEQDIRLIEIFNKYGLRGTFNISSGRIGQQRQLFRDGATVCHNKIKKEELTRVYKGHEVAGHTVDHQNLTALSDREITYTVEADRLALSDIMGYEVLGMAYPGAGVVYNKHVSEVIRQTTGMKYARIDDSAPDFGVPTDLFLLKPTCRQYKQFDRLYALAEQFIAMKPDTPQIFYIWGHSFEFDVDNSWEQMERFCKFIGGHEDIFYGTNREIFLKKQLFEH